jgi:integrase
MTVTRTSSGSWEYRFLYKGREYRKRFSSRQLAERAEARKRSELAGGVNVEERMTFADAAHLFFEKHSKPNKRSWVDDRGRIRVLNEFLGEKRLADITPEDIQDMRTELKRRGLVTRTVDLYHALVKAIINKMILWRKYTGVNPAMLVQLEAKSVARIRFLNAGDIARLLEHAHRELQPYILGALHTGMRRGELVDLRWRHVTLAIGDIFVERSKSGKARHIPINSALQGLLHGLWGGGKGPDEPVFGARTVHFVSHQFKLACRRAGLVNVRFHDLRHTFASQLAMAGVSIFHICKWLGHASVTTTEKFYAHLSPASGREYLECLNSLTNGSVGRKGSDKIRIIGGFQDAFPKPEKLTNAL